MKAIEKTLKDYGVDWKLDGESFKNLMMELELALLRVIE